MNNRLMKYMASTSPTVKKKYWRAFASSSGCRAMAAIVWEPARPSPTAAPMAPPPRASPPPTSAPAIRIAPSVVPAMSLFLLCRDRVDTPGWAADLVGLVPTHAHAEVHDGEKGEDEGLDRSDEQLVERLPDGEADPGQVGRDQRDDDGDYQYTREDVAEEPEGQRDR